MSLSKILGKTSPAKKHVRREVSLHLPPEYDISPDEWSASIQAFNRTDRPTRLAAMFVQFVSNREPDYKEFNTLLTVSEITKKDDHYVVDLFFDSSRAGLTTLLLFEAEKLIIAPVCNSNSNKDITHLVMVYPPN